MDQPPYKLLFARSVAKDLRSIPVPLARQILERITSLRFDPRPQGVTKLYGSEDRYRIRQGDYRIIYEVRDGELLVLVIKIGHRRDVYKR